MDSLKLSIVLQRLKAALKIFSIVVNGEMINARLVYSAPSVDKMTEALARLAERAGAHTLDGNGKKTQSRQ
jgi:hypothetical protein